MYSPRFQFTDVKAAEVNTDCLCQNDIDLMFKICSTDPRFPFIHCTDFSAYVYTVKGEDSKNFLKLLGFQPNELYMILEDAFEQGIKYLVFDSDAISIVDFPKITPPQTKPERLRRVTNLYKQTCITD